MRTASVRLAAISAAVLAVVGAAPVHSTQTAPAQGGAASATLPAPKELFAKHVNAVGGRDAMLAYSSRKVTGTMTMAASGMNGTLEIYQAKPNKFLMRITLPGVGTMEDGFDGTVAWGINPLTGPQLLQGQQLEDKKQDAVFQPDLDIERRYAAVKTVERTDFDGRPCYKVLLTRKGGGEDVFFFDATTGLRAGSVISRESPMGAITVTAYEGDYKQFGKVKYATRLRIVTMNIEQQMTLDTVEHDTVDPAVFAVPATIKALIK